MSGFEMEGIILEAIDENSEINENATEATGLQDFNEIPVELVNPENGGNVLVTGDPYGWANQLDWEQGDVYTDVQGDCGLVSCANFLTMQGIEVNEQEMIHLAIENGLCSYDEFGDPNDNGGTSAETREALLSLYGVEATVVEAGTPEGSPEAIANAVENGQSVMISVNAGYLWGEADVVGEGTNNHVVTVTGVERDANTGEVTGLIICDSGRSMESDACRTLSLEELKNCYQDVPGCTAIISDNSAI